MEYLAAVVVIVLLGAMSFAAFKLEPHWASKDGKRFMCNAQEMQGGRPVGRLRETKVAVLPDGSLHVSQKRMMRRQGSTWTLISKSDSPPRKREIYLARSRAETQGGWNYLAIRLPSNSRCVAVLDGILADDVTTSPPAPGTAAPEDRPDRG